MTYAAIATSWAITILLLLALNWGQPAGIQDERTKATASAADGAKWKATVMAYPQATPKSCNSGYSYGYSYVPSSC